MLPCNQRQNSAKMSRQRWARIIEVWKPFQRTFCTCLVIPASHFNGGDIHYKFRMFSSHLKFTAKDCGCSSKECSPAQLSKRLSIDLVGSLLRLGCFSVQNSPDLETMGGIEDDCRLQGEADRLTSEIDRTFTPPIVLIGAQELPDSAGSQPVLPMPVKAFPTDSKERQSAQKRKDKEAGVVREVKKIKKFIEDHHDDCGESLASIIPTEDSLFADCIDSSSDDEEDCVFHNLQLDFMWGGDRPCLNKFENLRTVYLSDMQDALDLREAYVSRACDTNLDIAEICGGVARTTQVGMRLKLKTGVNFDLVTAFDLTTPRNNKACLLYFETYTILCVVMAPVCGPYGPIANLCYHQAPQTMIIKEEEVRPLAILCGKVALIQMGKNLYFIQEQPHPSRLYNVDPWPKIMAMSQVIQIIYDRCAAGLKVLSGRFKGWPMKKPSTMTGNHPLLLKPFEGLRCKHSPGEHLSGDGHSRELRDAQIWTWREANLIIAGIMDLRKWLRKSKGLFSVRVFPIKCAADVASAQPGIDPGGEHSAAPLDRKQCKCYGCKNSRASTHWQHNRIIGECKYPYTKPFVPTCQACYDMKPITAAADGEWLHTFDAGCWSSGKQPRTYAKRGKHPRDPVRPVTIEETVGQRGDAGIELELELDAAAAARGGSRPADPSSSSSSSSSKPPMVEGSVPIGDGRHKMSKPERRAGPQQSKKSEGWPETLGGDGPADPDNWTQFDIARVLRTLRMATIPQAKVTLRKLHIRWWHASAQSMKKLLDRAGVPSAVLNLIDPIIQTCSACRNWAKPQPENVANVDLPDQFNHQVEADMMFVYDVIIFHLIDRSTRWYHSIVVPNREEGTLIDAIDSWVRVHGPMKELYMDQETAIQASDEVLQYFSRHGIHYEPRAKGQQVAYIDRRGALVREVMHKIVEQLKIEKIKLPIRFVLSEATFCTNAMVTVNNSTPYNCVYGRVPHILPSIDQYDAANEGSLEPAGTVRYTHRLREISVAATVQETAKVRAQRALQTRSLPAGQHEQYKPGDLVDFYRPAGSKDASGWIGPAKVIDPTHLDKGCITCRHVHRPIEIRIGDLRRHMPFLVFLASSNSFYQKEVASWQNVRHYVTSQVKCGKSVMLGHVCISGKWHRTPQTEGHMAFYKQAVHFVTNTLALEHVCAIRLGNGCGSCAAVDHMVSSHVVYWYTHSIHTHHIQHSSTGDGSVGKTDWRQLDDEH